MIKVHESTSISGAATTFPKVVAIVLNWNGWLDTIECVESLLRSSRPPDQVVVVDNASTDDSMRRLAEWAEGLIIVENHMPSESRWSYRPSTKPIAYTTFRSSNEALSSAMAPESPLVFIQTGTNLGYAGGNNIGLTYALRRTDCDYVWILNNDTVVDRHALEQTIALAESDSRAAIVGAKVLQYHQPALIQALGGGKLIASLGHDTQLGNGTQAAVASEEKLELEHVIGASLFVRREAVTSVGLMDEDYFLYREETDWCIRMRRASWRLYYCPGAVVWHKQGQSIGTRTMMHDYYSVRNMLFLIQKFHPVALPTALVVIAIRAIVPKIVRLQFDRLFFVYCAIRDFSRGIRGRSHSDAELMRSRTARRRA